MGGREKDRERHSAEREHRKVITQIQLTSDCCSIAVILYSWERFHISNKGQASASFMISLTHTLLLLLSLTHSQTQKMVHSHSGGKKTGNDIRIKKEVMTSTKSVCERDRESERVRESGTQSTGALEGWVTSYLFGMMKIFPSRQPFVALVPGTACQICFSSPSCLHTAGITNTSTHTVCLPCRPQQVCSSVTVVMCVGVCGGGGGGVTK